MNYCKFEDYSESKRLIIYYIDIHLLKITSYTKVLINQRCITKILHVETKCTYLIFTDMTRSEHLQKPNRGCKHSKSASAVTR